MRNYLSYSALLVLLGLSFARAGDFSESDLTAVSATVHNGYQREKLPDGSLKPVSYAFGEGTFDPGSTADPSLDRLKFNQLAVLLSGPLAKLGYQPGRERDKIEQLIVVHWGRTVGWDGSGYGDTYGNLNRTFDTMKGAFPTSVPKMPEPGQKQDVHAGPPSPTTRGAGGTPGAAGEMDQMLLMLQIQEDARNQANSRNSLLLGYQSTLAHTPTYFGNLVAPRREQLVNELEDDRYYVVLIAYDFQTTLKRRQPKVLWVTRFSLRAHGNDFDRSIDRMIRTAAPFFGRSSDGLFRENTRAPRVEPGELKVIEYLEPTKK